MIMLIMTSSKAVSRPTKQSLQKMGLNSQVTLRELHILGMFGGGPVCGVCGTLLREGMYRLYWTSEIHENMRNTDPIDRRSSKESGNDS